MIVSGPADFMRVGIFIVPCRALAFRLPRMTSSFRLLLLLVGPIRGSSGGMTLSHLSRGPGLSHGPGWGTGTAVYSTLGVSLCEVDRWAKGEGAGQSPVALGL